jgi:membrane-bound lytic murein transglycosylase A
VRGDLFWGFGPQAAERAGMMKDRGTYYLLLPRDVAARRSATS